jgi:uncharacterized sulfatase
MMVAMGKESHSIFALVRDPKQYPLDSILAAAELATQSDQRDVAKLTPLLSADHPAIRYWAAVGMGILKSDAAPAKPDLLRVAKEDDWPSVRIAAAEALVTLGEVDVALDVLQRELRSKDEWAALHAANVLEVIGDDARPAIAALREASQSGSDYVKRAATHTVAKLSK